MNKKYYFWNNYRGILILLIVFGSFLYTYSSKLDHSAADLIYTCLNTFCMPAFIFSYGYLSKTQKSRSRTSQAALLLYYFVFNTTLILLLHFWKKWDMQILYPTAAYWFVFSLIIWRAVIEPLSKIKGIIPISVAAALLMGFWGEFSNILSIRRTVAYFIFFLLGYKFEREKFKKMIRSRSPKKYLIALAVTCLGVVGLVFIVKNVNITHNMLIMGAYKQPLHLLYRVFIMAVSLCAIISLMMLTPNANISILSTFGRNSMLIYLCHRFVAELFTYLFKYKNYSRKYIIYAAIAAFFTCMIFGDSRLNRLVNGVTDRAALHVVNGDRIGKRIQTGILIVLLLIMAAFPLIRML